MFEDIPHLLTLKISALRRNPDSASEVYFFAARNYIYWCIGKDVSRNEEDPFMRHLHLSGRDVWPAHVSRVMSLAEGLFTLRSLDCFPEFCRRLSTRSIQSAFFEMMAAKHFHLAGFELASRPEIGLRGEDFDFSASREDQTINVEVTALTAPAFSENTIINALNQKRRQLPDTFPSVVYCVMPPSWVEDVNDWNNNLDAIPARFFGTTRRINAVVFWAEKHFERLPPERGGSWTLLRKAYVNDRARLPVANLEFLFEGIPAALVSLAAEIPTARESLAQHYRKRHGFYSWVDYALSMSA